VREAERLLATVEGLGLHAMLHGRWLDADLCMDVLRAQVASIGLASAGAAGAAAGIH
jgi:hypothetical protein